tara:strand:+ start:157 stop:999 length:843 start_codon:yes stop_codon:yes gene_type:complete
MIIWLASYPKSGNTWVRSIISSLIYSDDGNFNFEQIKKIKQFPDKNFFKDFVTDFSNFEEISKNWIVAQDKINLDGNIKLFKTHQGQYIVSNNYFTNKDNTIAKIYIVRDPRNLVKSVSNHFSLSIEEAYKFLISPEIIGNGLGWEERKDGIKCLLGKWNDHYNSWTRSKENLLVIKYEDLVSNPMNELLRIIEFLKKYIKFKTDDEKNIKILKTTSFDNLKQMENKGLFKENVINKETKSKVNFFHLGPKNKWQNSLDKEIIKTIENKFKNEMKELGYI